MRDIKLNDRDDRWRYVCPRDHRTWEPVDGHFYCQRCNSIPSRDGVFYQLRDKVDGELLERDEIQLITEAGEYTDSFREGSA